MWWWWKADQETLYRCLFIFLKTFNLTVEMIKFNVYNDLFREWVVKIILKEWLFEHEKFK